MKIQTLFVSVFAVVLLQACNSSTEPAPIDCALYDFANGGIFRSVLDSTSGVALGAVTAIAVDGKYFNVVATPTMAMTDPNPIYLVRDRAGEYDVYVSKEGYKPWVSYNVVVKPGACRGTQRIEMTAKLQQESALDSVGSRL